VSIAAAGHRAARSRLVDLARLADPTRPVGPAASSVVAECRVTDAWVAVRTGLDSNDLNGVVATGRRVPTPSELVELHRWWGSAPACWLASEADPALTEALLQAGWEAERSGRWAGRALDPGARPEAARRRDPSLAVRRVASGADLDAWADVAVECGWCEPAERDGLRRLAGLDALTRWVAVVADPGGADRTVGMATGWREADLVELVDVPVVPGHRRRGVGAGLIDAVCSWGDPATSVVAAPSPDGWALMRSLGFVDVPVEPDVCFYRAPR